MLTKDVVESLRLWRFWMHLGWTDILKQYRRSFLGPVWITLNTGLFIVAFGLLGSQIFRQSAGDYLLYFATGHIAFSFVSSLMNEGCGMFLAAEPYLKQAATPKFVFVFRVIVRNLIMLGHNAIIILCLLLWFGTLNSVRWAELLIGLAFLLVASVFFVSTIGALATRFRDIPLMVSTTLQIMFFMTPVMWRPDQLTERAQWLVVLNPFAIGIDLIRKPILGQPIEAQAIVSASIVVLLLAAVFFPIFLVSRRKLVYWL